MRRYIIIVMLFVSFRAVAQDPNFSIWENKSKLDFKTGMYNSESVHFVGDFRSFWGQVYQPFKTLNIGLSLPLFNQSAFVSVQQNKSGTIGFNKLNFLAGFNHKTQLNRSVSFTNGLSLGLSQLSIDNNALTWEDMFSGESDVLNLTQENLFQTSISPDFNYYSSLITIIGDCQLKIMFSANHLLENKDNLTGLGDLGRRISLGSDFTFRRNKFLFTPFVSYQNQNQFRETYLGGIIYYSFSKMMIGFGPGLRLNDAFVSQFYMKNDVLTLSLSHDATISKVNVFNRGDGAIELGLNYTFGKKKSSEVPIVSKLVEIIDSIYVRDTIYTQDTLVTTVHDTVLTNEIINATIILEDLYFPYDIYAIQPDHRLKLFEIAKYAFDNPQLRIMVSGHTDHNGSDMYNYKLGQQRAETIKQYLVNLGVPISRISISTLGELFPKATNLTSKGKSLNRRVEVRLF